MGIGLGILGLVFLGLAWLIWYHFEYQLKNMFRLLRVAEMWLVSMFVDDDYTIIWNGQPTHFKDTMQYFSTARPSDLDGLYDAVAMFPMIPLRWPFIIIMAMMGFWSYSNGPGSQYRRKMNLDGLIGAQAKTFPIIRPFVKFNPSKQPPRPPGAPVPADLPLFAEALGPEEWLAFTRNPLPDGQVDEQAAYMAFARQLGGRWRGAQELAPYKQILLAAFCLKAARKRQQSDDFLGRLARCWTPEKGLQLNRDRALLREARKVLRDKNLSAMTLGNCNQHAFENTALLRGLQTAREEGGVLAPAQFVWLRAHDRNLWYPLNNLGRQAYHMEALGAMCHFKAEKMTRRPIPKPKVDNAIISISQYMRSTRARPIPQLDYSRSQKRGVMKPKVPK